MFLTLMLQTDDASTSPIKSVRDVIEPEPQLNGVVKETGIPALDSAAMSGDSERENTTPPPPPNASRSKRPLQFSEGKQSAGGNMRKKPQSQRKYLSGGQEFV